MIISFATRKNCRLERFDVGWATVFIELGKHVIDAIDRGVQRRRARRRARRAKRKQATQAAGKAAQASSQATDEMMRKKR